MLTWFARSGLYTLALSATLILGFSAAYADNGPMDHMTMPAAKAEFKGDTYLLGTDPVTGDKLPDAPLIYQHEGRELRFADQKSLDTFKADTAKYLPKVDEQMIQQQLPFYPLDTCMISGDNLGGDMGKAVDLIYKNRLLRFCCKDCVKDFQKDPAKYIAKLDAAVIARQGPNYPLTTCPVSGDKLGGDMGKAVEQIVGNRLVRFCCADCPKDFAKNPLKYLKVIDDAAQKRSADTKPGPSDGAAKSPDHAGHQH